MSGTTVATLTGWWSITYRKQALNHSNLERKNLHWQKWRPCKLFSKPIGGKQERNGSPILPFYSQPQTLPYCFHSSTASSGLGNDLYKTVHSHYMFH